MEDSPMDIVARDLIQASEAPVTEHFPELEDFDSIAEPVTTAEAVSSLQAVHDVPVTVQAVLGRARIAIGALMQLKANAVIELDRRVGEPVDIFVNNRLIARGEVVLIENALGVTLTEIVRQER
ncbi:flagellar motor switch protein FliN [Sphingomonas sp. PAMC 26621]|uniref:flagellar motor switch protein FliN n=1 Tax=Sphingomonas sp. PAMC 26621 TaxID=1112213 RepID=UPI003FD5E276